MMNTEQGTNLQGICRKDEGQIKEHTEKSEREKYEEKGLNRINIRRHT